MPERLWSMALLAGALTVGCSKPRTYREPTASEAGLPDASEAGLPDAREAGVAARVTAHRLSASEVERRHEGQRARAGDVSIANDLVRFVITGSRGADTYTDRAGSVIDAVLVGTTVPQSYDGIDELSPLVNGCPIDAADVEIVSDGHDGQRAEVLVRGQEVLIPHAINLLENQPEAHRLDIEVRYSLAPDERALRIVTSVQNPHDHEVPAAIGDFVLFGEDEGESFTLPGGFDSNAQLKTLGAIGSMHEYLPWSALVFGHEGPLTLVSDASVDDMIGRGEAGLWQYTLSNAPLASGERVEVTRSVSLGHDISETLEPLNTLTGNDLGRVHGRVSAAGRLVQGARVSFFADDALTIFRGQTLTDQTGEFDASLPTGQVFAVASGRGNGEHVVVEGRPRLLAEGHVPSPAQALTVARGEDVPLDFDLAPTGNLTVRVTDRESHALPSKLTFRRVDGPRPLRVVGERAPYEAHDIAYIFWALDGHVDAEIAPGKYTVTASHGPRYSIAERVDLTVLAGANEGLALELERQVPDLGFVAIDSHAHGMDSQHGEVSRAERVITCLVEGLDVHIATDHDRVVDYLPVVSALALTGAITPIPSVELTSLVGHHNIWPLVPDGLASNGGGFRWWLGGSLDELYDYYADMGGIVFQVNHGKSYFEDAGFDRTTGKALNGEKYTDRFNAMEIQSGKRATSRAYLVPTFHALLNTGHPVAPLGTSDSHQRAPEPGMARTYVLLDASRKGPPDGVELARAVVAMRTVASTGPLIELESADGTATLGEHLKIESGTGARLRIAVWAPSWMPIQRVRLHSKEGVVAEWDSATTPAVSTSGGGTDPWFAHEVEVRPARDGWYAVEAEGDGDLAPVYPNVTPWAHTAPIFVDVVESPPTP